MVRLLQFLSSLIQLYIYVIIASAVMSWLIAFNVVNPYNQFVRSLWQGFNVFIFPSVWSPETEEKMIQDELRKQRGT